MVGSQLASVGADLDLHEQRKTKVAAHVVELRSTIMYGPKIDGSRNRTISSCQSPCCSCTCVSCNAPGVFSVCKC